MPFALRNGVASAAALLLRCQVLHHPAKVDNSRARLVDGGVPIFHARLPVRELLRLVVCVGVDFLLDLVAHIREGQLSGEPMVENQLSVMSDRLLSKETKLPSLAGWCSADHLRQLAVQPA